MNGENSLQNMIMDYSIHKGSFQILMHQTFFKNLDYFSYSYVSSMRLRNVWNTAGLNHFGLIMTPIALSQVSYKSVKSKYKKKSTSFIPVQNIIHAYQKQEQKIKNIH